VSNPRRDITDRAINPSRITRGYLAEDYDGIGQYVLVTLTHAGTSGALRARIASGDFGGGRRFPAGLPVTLHSYRGQLEVLDLGNFQAKPICDDFTTRVTGELGGPTVEVLPSAEITVIDDFENRTANPGWGTASSGFSWLYVEDSINASKFDAQVYTSGMDGGWPIEPNHVGGLLVQQGRPAGGNFAWSEPGLTGKIWQQDEWTIRWQFAWEVNAVAGPVIAVVTAGGGVIAGVQVGGSTMILSSLVDTTNDSVAFPFSPDVAYYVQIHYKKDTVLEAKVWACADSEPSEYQVFGVPDNSSTSARLFIGGPAGPLVPGEEAFEVAEIVSVSPSGEVTTYPSGTSPSTGFPDSDGVSPDSSLHVLGASASGITWQLFGQQTFDPGIWGIDEVSAYFEVSFGSGWMSASREKTPIALTGQVTIEVVFSVSPLPPAAGDSSIDISLYNNNWDSLGVDLSISNTDGQSLLRADTPVNSGSYSAAEILSGRKYHLKLFSDPGVQVQGKFWLDGDPEPEWQLTVDNEDVDPDVVYRYFQIGVDGYAGPIRWRIYSIRSNDCRG
jgi:hypothetical protein